MSLRAKLILTIVLLVVLAGAAIGTAIYTVQAFHDVQHQTTLVAKRDTRTIRPWMTIPYISRNYHVPTSYLYQSLHIRDECGTHHLTLHGISLRYKQSLDAVIRDVQRAITTYRQHPQSRPGTPGTQNARGTPTVEPKCTPGLLTEMSTG